jgi:hypothetical protein
VSGTTAAVTVSCTGSAGATCLLTLQLTVVETRSGHRLVAVTAASRSRTTVVLGSATVTLQAGSTRTVKVSLNGTGRRLLSQLHTLKAKLLVSQLLAGAHRQTLSSQTVTFKAKRGRRGH